MVTGDRRAGDDDARPKGFGLRTDVNERDLAEGDRVATDEEIPV